MADFLLKQLDSLQTSFDVLNSGSVLKLQGAGKNLLTGRQRISSPAQAVQLFKDTIFGKAKDKFTYRSTFGTPVRNYLLIKGREPNPTQTDGEFAKKDTELSSYRVKYVNKENKVPNTWRGTYSSITDEHESFPAIFMDTALITVSMKKNIIKTPVVGHDGTRKEYISQGDYDIDITGEFTSGESDIFPEADVEALIKALSAPIALEIACPQLYRFGITRMVVDSFKLPQEEGIYSKQKITIKAVSHAPNYAEIGQELANDNQDKGVIRDVTDKIANLSSSIDDQIFNFFGGTSL